ncbi:MAG: hypothetical protein EOP42_10320 [Sphingobacteriaceae bacterium]|nr:MAG: hypothetical protein EOP42_10320 [Sphingobacteriaceae bacterium]
MKKALLFIIFYQLVSVSAYSQSNQQKAQNLVTKYISSKYNLKSNQNLKFNPIEISRSSYADTKQYKNYVYKIDSLKLEARKIDARFAKLKTTAEINQSKKDSKNLSNQLVATSDVMIDFMTTYKGQQIGWLLKMVSGNKIISKKRFYLNMDLTEVSSVK